MTTYERAVEQAHNCARRPGFRVTTTVKIVRDSLEDGLWLGSREWHEGLLSVYEHILEWLEQPEIIETITL